ncbi:cytochrome c [Aestuariirhabdus litorea]|uniref:Cytochrome c n=2 Tax=Aestuariirhabdus litorea TaxID=2528527 RepID=A0A3P3VR53_9GAMM|nr:cytochrome c [Aestuariirhabdus litorea]RWW98731.1 c-type cytochrome [Endozoicomonadaceae bacterium GTF-13]
MLVAVASWAASVGGASAQSAEDEAHEQGRELYNYRCYYCHGYSGDAKTLAATFMSPPPRDFTSLDPGDRTREQMISTVTQGVPGTAMVSFTHYLDARQIELVVDFIRREFVEAKRVNTRYHTEANGWPEHDRYELAFPFAEGTLALDMPPEQMSDPERAGYRLFMNSCVSCHDRARVVDEGVIWRPRSISYPRNNFSFTQPPAPDALTSASVYAQHDRMAPLLNPTPKEAEGERLFQQNCAFCHAADGSGKNWIGAFLESAPRDLTDPDFINALGPERLAQVIASGVEGTSMPAWRSVLTGEQIDAIVHYIYRAFHTGQSEEAK